MKNRKGKIGLVGPTRYVAACACALGFLLFAPALRAETIKLTFASGLPPVVPTTKTIVNTFLPAVNKELEAAGSKNRVEWNVAVAGSLAKLNAILDVTRDGLADVSELFTVFEPVRLPLESVGFATPFTSSDYRIASLAVDQMNKTMPAMEKEWTKHNLVYLTGYSNDYYVIMAKKPITSIEDMKGLKIGVAGVNMNWLKGTGAVGVLTSFATAYNDMKTGVFDATIAPLVGGTNIKLPEVAPYIVKVDLGAAFAGTIVVNKTRWDQLPDDVKVAMKKAAATFQAAYFDELDKDVANVYGRLKKAGATVLDFPNSERVKWAHELPPIGLEWAQGVEAKGLPGKTVLKDYLDYQRKHSVVLIRDWDKN
jgi:TRAP-type transport system periplasmic protein